jgi:hypothetical protein
VKKSYRIMGLALAGVMPLSMVAEPAMADPVSDEFNFVQKLNDLRASRGVGPLGMNGHLTNVARGWSAHMASGGTISHNPNMAAQAPSNWLRLGENVGMGPSVQSLHDAFVASPPHYQNMVNGYYDSVGAGVVMRGSTMFVTVNFMQSRVAAAPVHVPAPAPVHMFAPPPPPPPPAPQVFGRTVCKRAHRGRVVCRRVKARSGRRVARRVKARKARVVRRSARRR